MTTPRFLLPLALVLLAAPVPSRGQAPERPGPERAVEERAPEEAVRPWTSPLRDGAVVLGYAGLYGTATKVGSRFGLERRFHVVRLESAYVYDLVAHAWVVKELGSAFGRLHRWQGYEEPRATRLGAWGGAFGSLLYMEAINGFMPGVRFDPLDPVANAVGAWLASEGPALARRHPWMRRFSFQFGYKDWGRVFGPARSSGLLGNVWHDYPNGRLGVGYDLGSAGRPWLTVMASYEITDWEIETLRNRVGLGVEFKPDRLLEPLLHRMPAGRSLLRGWRWLDRRLILPGLYVELWHHDLDPFSDREPFHE